MAKILIEIPDNWYEQLQNDIAMARKFYTSENYEKLILEGTLLPKGHGKLIDADDIDNHIIGHVDTRSCPTIIEADKER